MSGEVDLTAGYTCLDGEKITATKLNQLVTAIVLRIAAGAVGNRELAAGSISSDKLDADISAQLALPDGIITLAKLADGVLEDSATGRGKMADGFLSADTAGRAKMDDAFVTAAKCSPGDFIPAAASLYACRVNLGTDQAVAGTGTPAKVLLDTERHDSGTAFANYKFTAKAKGIHKFYGQACFKAIPNGTICRAYLYKNGVAFANSRGPVQGGATSYNTPTVYDEIELAIGDYVELYASQDSGSSKDLYGLSTLTYLCGRLIGTTT